MRKLKNDILINIISLLFMVLITILSESRNLIYYVSFIYLVQFCVIVFIGYIYYERDVFFLSPTFIYLSYTNISFIAGSFLLSIGQDFNDVQILHYLNLANLKIITIIFLFANSVSMFAYKTIDKKQTAKLVNMNLNLTLLIIGLVGFFIFSIIYFDLSFLGGDGNFSLYPKTFFLILIFYYLAKRKNKIRIIYYIILIVIFASTHFESKREAISLLFPVLFLEVKFKNIKIFNNLFKTFWIGISTVTLLFFFIISMSIARGYGGFGVKGYFDSFKHIPEYIQSSYFSKVIIANTEVTLAYFHSVDAIDIVLEDVNHLQYGKTVILKPILVPVPRDVYPDKPESAVLWYTRVADPLYLAKGGSSPINIISELFLNFYYLYIIAVYFLFALFNKLYFKMANLLRQGNQSDLFLILYSYTILFSTIRGQGFDIFIIGILVVLPFYFVLKIFTKSDHKFTAIKKRFP